MKFAVSPEVARLVKETEPELNRPSKAYDEAKVRACIDEILEANEVKSEDLTPGQWAIVLLHVPCDVYCWRVGGAVPYSEDGICVECGHPKPRRTVWERILRGEVVS